MGLARKIREEYNQAGTIVEQAISSIRTFMPLLGKEMKKFELQICIFA
jgi:hypothetical protein